MAKDFSVRPVNLRDENRIKAHFLALLELLPGAANTESVELAIAGIILNYILPAFFLMISIMTASVMAASAFVGEKEKHTLVTLL